MRQIFRRGIIFGINIFDAREYEGYESQKSYYLSKWYWYVFK